MGSPYSTRNTVCLNVSPVGQVPVLFITCDKQPQEICHDPWGILGVDGWGLDNHSIVCNNPASGSWHPGMEQGCDPFQSDLSLFTEIYPRGTQSMNKLQRAGLALIGSSVVPDVLRARVTSCAILLSFIWRDLRSYTNCGHKKALAQVCPWLGNLCDRTKSGDNERGRQREKEDERAREREWEWSIERQSLRGKVRINTEV